MPERRGSAVESSSFANRTGRLLPKLKLLRSGILVYGRTRQSLKTRKHRAVVVVVHLTGRTRPPTTTVPQRNIQYKVVQSLGQR